MRKQLFIFILLVVFSLTAKAQSSSGAFGNGNNLINLGIGLGSPFFGTGYTASLPINPSISFEHGIADEISIGGQASFASAKYSYALFGSAYNFKETAIYIGARGSYHFNELLDMPDKFDLYGGATAGYVIANVSDNEGYSASAASALGIGAFAGGKYYFSSATALYAELGYQSLSFLNFGISFKF